MNRHLFRAEDGAEYYFEEGCYILEHLNDPADPQASIARARVPPGTRTRAHRLHGTTERYFILAGTGLAHVGDDEPVAVGAGDVVLIPPGASQHVVNTGSADLVFLAICTPRFEPGNYCNC